MQTVLRFTVASRRSILCYFQPTHHSCPGDGGSIARTSAGPSLPSASPVWSCNKDVLGGLSAGVISVISSASPGLDSESLPTLGKAGSGLSGLIDSGRLKPATCLNPGFGSVRGVLGRDGVPRKLSRLPFKSPIRVLFEGVEGREGLGMGSALSTEV